MMFLLHACTPAGPFKNFPQITVYHPDSDHGFAFANIGWTGWIGSITGQLLNVWINLVPRLLSEKLGNKAVLGECQLLGMLMEPLKQAREHETSVHINSTQ